MFAMHLNQSYGSSVTYSALSSSPHKPLNHISQLHSLHFSKNEKVKKEMNSQPFFLYSC